MTSEIFTALTASALIFGLLAKLWLNLRQQRFVTARRGAVPEAFAGQIDLPAHQKAADYLCAQSRLNRADLVLGAILFLVLTWGGLLAWLNHFWEAQFSSTLWRGAVLIASVALLSMLLDLPLAAYRSFSLEARFGFNRMTPKLFCQDLLKNTLLAILLGLPFLLLILWLMTAAGNFWWFYAWLVLAGFNLLMMVIYPLWIAPWFNRFTPLAPGEARERIEQLLKRGNFSARAIFVMDGSRRSTHGNAYFTGFGKSRRIVFFDTLLERLTPPQIEAVLAHELGHFHHRHIIKRIALIFVFSLAFFALLGHLMYAPWFFAALGVGAENTGDAALALLLFTLVVPLFAFFFTPLFSHLSRRDEFQADAYAVRMSSATALVEALVKLYRDNASTLTPDPLYSRFYDSHPPASERVARLLSADPASASASRSDADTPLHAV
ncbi:MAG: M48 family metallopeptidase [Betaproteobacteria bacterium]|nr:M48 family metallopeptidase [Betaproteobacteria bacterium]